jgi:hypothetical protein
VGRRVGGGEGFEEVWHEGMAVVGLLVGGLEVVVQVSRWGNTSCSFMRREQMGQGTRPSSRECILDVGVWRGGTGAY